MTQLRLLSTRRFWPLFITQFLGAFNDNVLKNALVILITFRTSSVLGLPAIQMVALCGGIFILPFFLFSATAGQLADKYEKATIIRWIKFIEVFIMVLATIGFVGGHIEFLLTVLFLMGLHSTFFGPLKYSILPQLLDERELLGGNALIESGTFLSILLGTITGGNLIGSTDFNPWIVSGVLLLIALIGWGSSLLIPRAPAAAPNLDVQWNPWPPTVEILRCTAQHHVVWHGVLGISWFWFFGGSMLSLFPPWCKDVLRMTEGGVTLFLALFSIGIGLGSMLCERLSGRRLELGLVPFGSLGMTIFALDLWWAGTPHFAQEAMAAGTTVPTAVFYTTLPGLRILIDLLLLATFGGFFIVPLYTVIQERSERAFRSRIVAGNNIVNSGFMVVSALMIAGMLGMGLSIPAIFGIMALMNLAVAVYIYSRVPEFMLRFVAWIVAQWKGDAHSSSEISETRNESA